MNWLGTEPVNDMASERGGGWVSSENASKLNYKARQNCIQANLSREPVAIPVESGEKAREKGLPIELQYASR